MCKSYYFEKDDEIVQAMTKSQLGIQMRNSLAAPVISYGKMLPGQIVPSIALSKSGNRTVFPMVYGSINNHTLTTTAKLESVSTLDSYKEAWKSYRCAVPFSWYYENQRTTLNDKAFANNSRMLVQPKGLIYAYMAALYRKCSVGAAFVILTTMASDSVKPLCDRMPVILPESSIDMWINPSLKPIQSLRFVLRDMVVEPALPDKPIQYY